MNIAYLVIVHHQPLQLFRSIDRLDQPNAFFFIHIDTKSADKAVITDHFSTHTNVQIISEYDVKWAGFTQVEVEVALMKMAFSSGIDLKYYVLLSGQDYPIKSNSYIYTFFERHNTDFISYNSISYMPEEFKDKVRYYHFPDIPLINPRSSKKIPLLVKLYFGLHKRLKPLMPVRRFYKDMQPYFGSNWFALTQDTVKYILEFIDANKGYVQFMRYTENADETFIHTIIFNSDRKNNAYDYAKYSHWLKTRKEGEVFVPGYSSLRYMDWSERAKTKPATLDLGYYDEIKASGDLFARKFDERISAELLDRVDAELL